MFLLLADVANPKLLALQPIIGIIPSLCVRSDIVIVNSLQTASHHHWIPFYQVTLLTIHQVKLNYQLEINHYWVNFATVL